MPTVLEAPFTWHVFISSMFESRLKLNGNTMQAEGTSDMLLHHHCLFAPGDVMERAIAGLAYIRNVSIAETE